MVSGLMNSTAVLGFILNIYCHLTTRLDGHRTTASRSTKSKLLVVVPFAPPSARSQPYINSTSYDVSVPVARLFFRL